ncbi:DUF2959 domain-containing protein [Pleionea sediminis]|uniref:DUF2959 domain-containing protein n=1 Tax=Pleionea sediminis TaxID=2569479 RepID=UPI001184FCCF|nr:DUF2959 domain-containing protein [Pleionea sediminis]
MHHQNLFQLKVFSAVTILTLVTACQSAYYGALEKVGIHKRDVLVSRVEKTRNSQQEAKKQFASALAEFKSVTLFKGKALEEIYERLNDEYESSVSIAEEIRARIDDVQSVSDALFNEWEAELIEYTSPTLRQKSTEQLNLTKSQYRKMIKSMNRAEKSMQPVLNVFKDQVLFLKHNLNARAIASLKSEISSIENNVSRLIQQMNLSIDDANQFIQSMK